MFSLCLEMKLHTLITLYIFPVNIGKINFNIKMSDSCFRLER